MSIPGNRKGVASDGNGHAAAMRWEASQEPSGKRFGLSTAGSAKHFSGSRKQQARGKLLKRFIAALAVACVALALTGAGASAHTGRQYRLRFEFGDKGSAKWQANVDDSPLDSNTSRLKLNVPYDDLTDPTDNTTTYDYIAVYAYGTGLSGQLLGNVRNLSFDFFNAEGNGDGVRYSIPIDVNGDGTWDYPTEGYAFGAARDCREPIPSSTTGWERTDFTGRTAPGCTIYGHDGVAYTSDGINSAWDNYAAAYPAARVAVQSQAVAFIILDDGEDFPNGATVFLDRMAFQNHMFVKYGSGPGAIKHCPMESSC
jgi:hypothetical protein